jgi:hypothetical protein
MRLPLRLFSYVENFVCVRYGFYVPILAHLPIGTETGDDRTPEPPAKVYAGPGMLFSAAGRAGIKDPTP